MPVPHQAESILLDEWHSLVGSLRDQITDQAEAAAVVAMGQDALMLLVRRSRGEDVTDLVAALNAEAQNLAVRHRTMAQQAVITAWTRAGVRLLGGVLMGAV